MYMYSVALYIQEKSSTPRFESRSERRTSSQAPQRTCVERYAGATTTLQQKIREQKVSPGHWLLLEQHSWYPNQKNGDWPHDWVFACLECERHVFRRFSEFWPTGALWRRKLNRPHPTACGVQRSKRMLRDRNTTPRVQENLSVDKMHVHTLTGLYCDACDAKRGSRSA